MPSVDELAKSLLNQFNENKDFEYGDKASMDKRNAAAEQYKSLKRGGKDPFAPLERDLPRGGRQIKIAEPLGAAALPAAEAAASGIGRIAGGVGVGMLIPSSTGVDPKEEMAQKGLLI